MKDKKEKWKKEFELRFWSGQRERCKEWRERYNSSLAEEADLIEKEIDDQINFIRQLLKAQREELKRKVEEIYRDPSDYPVDSEMSE